MMALFARFGYMTTCKQVSFRCQHHGHGSSFHLGVLFNIGIFLGFLCNVSEYLPAQVGKGNLAAPEYDGNLDLVLIFDEPTDVVQFYLDIMLACFGPNLDFLDLKGALLLFGLLQLLGLFVLKPTIVHDFTYRRTCIRRDLNQIETEITGNGKSLVGWNNAYLFSVRVDDSDFFCSDILVDIGSVRSNVSVWSFWKNYTRTSLSGIWV